MARVPLPSGRQLGRRLAVSASVVLLSFRAIGYATGVAWDAVIGLGANLGRPRQAFEQALARLPEGVEVLARSGLYRTAPIGPAQPDFLNAAVRVESVLAPQQLLIALLGVEAALGRVRDQRWGPRCIDLDLLWVRGLSLTEPKLTLPHPRLTERAFALRPLLDVAPDALDPSSGRRYSEWLAGVEAQDIERVSGVDSWPNGRD